MTRADLLRKGGCAPRLRGPLVLGAASLLLGACNSILGITTPVDLPVDAAGDGAAVSLPDAGPDRADAGPDGVDANHGAIPEAGVDSVEAGGDAADAGADSGEAGSNADATDGNQGPLLMITPTTLPDAPFNLAYSATFTASGGSGAAQSWTATGTLPPGLELALDGTLRGVPVQEGVFPFDISVSEEPPGTGTGTEHVTLMVVRKHWLAYHANPDGPLNFGIFAIDVESPYLQTRVSSNLPVATGSADKFGFSPDGKYIAFLGYAVAEGLDQLYVVDMTGDAPGTPSKVNEYGSVIDFAWSPDGRYLAFDDEAEGTTAILVADMTQPQTHPEEATTATGSLNDIGFVTSDLLTYWLDNLAFTRRPANGMFAGAQSFTFGGALIQRWPDLESALFATFGDTCQDQLWNVIDFRDPVTYRQLTGFVSVSPGRDFIAYRDNSDDHQYNVYSTWGMDPIATFPTGSHYCAPGSWSHDGSLFVAGGDEDTLQVTRINGATAATTPLPGSYGTVGENGPPLFSPDDHWLGFSTDLGAFVVENDHGSLGAAIGDGVPVNTPPFGDRRIAFSPDSTFLASAEASSLDRAAAVLVTDLRHGPPITLALSPYPALGIGSGVNALGWSSDSTNVAFVIRDAAYPAPTDLYLVSPTQIGLEDPTRSNVTRFPACDMDASTCRSVDRFEFQP